MRKLFVIAAGLALLPGLAWSQGLDAIAKAMGADKVGTIAYSGAGTYYALGQSLTPEDRWPRFVMESYKANVNYAKSAMVEDIVVSQGEHPPRGGGRQPVRGKQERSGAVMGDVAWSPGPRPRPARESAPMIHALWTSPHGVVKALQAQGATLETRHAGGKDYRTARFARKDAFRAEAWFDKEGLLRGVDARVANPVFGDMVVKTIYGDYRSVDGVPFPHSIKVITEGRPTLELTVAAVQPNAPADIAVPEGIGAQRHNARLEEAAPGVFFVGGGSHNSVAIDMGDYITVVEGPLNDGRAGAVIEAVKKRIPGKLIRFAVNSHHHFDHSGGLRRFAAEGAAIVTQAGNVRFYQSAYRSRHRIAPDVLAKSGKPAAFIGVGEKYLLGAGDNRLELHWLKGSSHCGTMLIGYMPAHRFLIVADAYSGRGKDLSAPAARPDANARNLMENIERLGLDIVRVLPLHGAMKDFSQVRYAAGKP